MADVNIDADVTGLLHAFSGRGGPFWISTTVGYIIYVDSTNNLVWSKTENGGANWSAANEIVPAAVRGFDCWADWQTDGDAGTKIHIACVEDATDTVMYAYLDTSDDSEGTDTIEACQGTGTIRAFSSRAAHEISITKTRGGNLAVAFRYEDDAQTAFYGFYTSPDGDTWTSKNTPWEATDDHILLFPANLADNQDLWAIFWDLDADEIDIKTFDNSGNSWAIQNIVGTMLESTFYLQMDGAIRFSDGHLIFTAWSRYDNADSDLKCWDITDAGTITAKTNLITDTAEYFLCSVLINQDNDDIYVAYVGGASAQSLTQARYQKSDDGGGTWSGDTYFRPMLPMMKDGFR